MFIIPWAIPSTSDRVTTDENYYIGVRSGIVAVVDSCSDPLSKKPAFDRTNESGNEISSKTTEVKQHLSTLMTLVQTASDSRIGSRNFAGALRFIWKD